MFFLFSPNQAKPNIMAIVVDGLSSSGEFLDLFIDFDDPFCLRFMSILVINIMFVKLFIHVSDKSLHFFCKFISNSL